MWSCWTSRRQILELTKAVHAVTAARANGADPDHTRGTA